MKILTLFHNFPLETTIVAFVTFLLTWLGDGAIWLLYLYILICMDLTLAVIKAYSTGSGMKSHGIYKSCLKAGIYAFIMLVSVNLDKIITDDSLLVTRAVMSMLAVGEVWSILSQLAILCPQILAFKLIKKLLTAEIAEKMNISVDELNNVLNNKADDGKDR